ncbi:MAG: hypothetical protein QOH06_4568 [Acidobacteriota bacterium]|jgi:hypothetical protein|nr:hypothetical protein [Acidobacteriota bacterium]
MALETGSGTGHAIGFQIFSTSTIYHLVSGLFTETPNRFINPNTCEAEFDSVSTLRAFFQLYLNNMLSEYKMYSLYRFDP